MINPSELRLGNFVYIGLHARQVTSIDQKASFNIGLDDDDIYGDDEITPIPITPEWLERLGFIMSEDYRYSIELKDERSLECWRHNYLLKSPYQSVFIYDIQYVHQLQNLYHALTGQELTIKPGSISH